MAGSEPRIITCQARAFKSKPSVAGLLADCGPQPIRDVSPMVPKYPIQINIKFSPHIETLVAPKRWVATSEIVYLKTTVNIYLTLKENSKYKKICSDMVYPFRCQSLEVRHQRKGDLAMLARLKALKAYVASIIYLMHTDQEEVPKQVETKCSPIRMAKIALRRRTSSLNGMTCSPSTAQSAAV